MPKFASLSNYTYQISYTLNACVKCMFCILCIVVTMSLQCLSPNKISVLFCIKLQENYVQSHFVRMAQMLNIREKFEDFSSLEIAIK